MSFEFYVFIFRFSNVFSLNSKSFFKLTSVLSNILLVEAATDNCIYKVDVSRLKFNFKINGCCQFLNIKGSSSILQLQQKQLFCILFFWKLVYLSKSLRNIKVFSTLKVVLPNVFEDWRFLFISLTFGNTLECWGLYFGIGGKISLLFFNLSLLSRSWRITRAFSIPFSKTISGYFFIFQNYS